MNVEAIPETNMHELRRHNKESLILSLVTEFMIRFSKEKLQNSSENTTQSWSICNITLATLINFGKHIFTVLIDLTIWFTLASLLILPNTLYSRWKLFVTFSFLANVLTEWQPIKWQPIKS